VKLTKLNRLIHTDSLIDWVEVLHPTCSFQRRSS